MLVAHESALGSGIQQRSKLDDDSVLGRAAAVMEAFSRSDPSCSLNELTVRTGLPKSTVHRFAERLVELGWLDRSGAEYCVGVRMFEVGGWAERSYRIRQKASTHLQRLSGLTQCAAQLAILDGTDVLYLEIIPTRSFTPPSRDGGRMPAYCTGLGKAMLAYTTQHEFKSVIGAGLERRTPYTVASPSQLMGALAQVRRIGVALDHEEAFRGISCVSAPIRGSGRPIAAISVCGPSVPFDTRRLTDQVLRTASAIWADFIHRSETVGRRPAGARMN